MFVDAAAGSERELPRLLETAFAPGAVSLVVDLGDRVDASSDLLAALHRTARRARSLGGTLGVVSRQPSLRRLFDLTLLSQAFAVFSTRDEALQSRS